MSDEINNDKMFSMMFCQPCYYFNSSRVDLDFKFCTNCCNTGVDPLPWGEIGVLHRPLIPAPGSARR